MICIDCRNDTHYPKYDQYDRPRCMDCQDRHTRPKLSVERNGDRITFTISPLFSAYSIETGRLTDCSDRGCIPGKYDAEIREILALERKAAA